MLRTAVFLVLLLGSGAFAVQHEEENNSGICGIPWCECSAAGHPSWTMINCTMPKDEMLDIRDGDLPDTTSELSVSGGQELYVGPNSLSKLHDLRLVSVRGTRRVVLKRSAAVDLNLISAFLNIDHCHELIVESKAFSNIRGPLTVAIRHCDSVSMEGDAFSWLLKITVENVQNLILSPGAFTLEPTAANVGKHGPGMSIELRNLSIHEIPANTFGSSAAEVVLERVTVGIVHSAAFSANTFNVIELAECIIDSINTEAFAQKSLINKLEFRDCKINTLKANALQSAVTKLEITQSTFNFIETGAISITVATVIIADSEFHSFETAGFILSSWNRIYIARNKFDTLPPSAITAPTKIKTVHELIFIENEIENAYTNSLGFIGQIFDSDFAVNVMYKENYFGVSCNCNITQWLSDALGLSGPQDYFEGESYCTINEFFARCFNEPEQNIILLKFMDNVCNDESTIQCETFKTKNEGKSTEIKNKRFPHNKYQYSLSEKNKKVIGIVIVTALGCVIIVMFITLIKWLKRRGYCARLKNILMSSNSTCGSFCNRLCMCGRNNGVENARTNSRLSVVEYSDRHLLSEAPVNENVIVTFPTPVEEIPPMDDKITQTLPEQLTKELLENLKEKLEDPENYVAAREMIEHLYELIKVEESCNANAVIVRAPENIYELPFQNTTPRIGKNKMQMISVGTKVPSLEKLMPLSPYNRETALAHEYFEPKDFAVHLYAEIANCDKEKRSLLGRIPDIVEQVVPRGPYLRAIREKELSSSSCSPSKSYSSSTKSPMSSPSSSHMSTTILSPSTIKSNKSVTSNSSGKMINRPLPEKPLDVAEGTSAIVPIQG